MMAASDGLPMNAPAKPVPELAVIVQAENPEPPFDPLFQSLV